MKLLAVDTQIRQLLELRFELYAELDRLRKLPLDLVEPEQDRTIAERLGTTIQSCDATELALREAMDTLPKRVDGAAWLLKELKILELAKRAMVAELEAEARQCKAMREWYEQRLVDYIESHDLLEYGLRGEAVVMKAVKNPEKVEVTQPELLPRWYQRFTVTLSGAFIDVIVAEAVASGNNELKEVARHIQGKARADEPAKSEIAKALKLKGPCENCSGTGEVYPRGPNDAWVETCPQCQGTKTVVRGVPGARLVQGKRIEVK